MKTLKVLMDGIVIEIKQKFQDLENQIKDERFERQNKIDRLETKIDELESRISDIENKDK